MYVTCIPVYSKQWKEDDGGLKGRGWGGGGGVGQDLEHLWEELGSINECMDYLISETENVIL